MFIVQFDEKIVNKIMVDAQTWRNTTSWVDVDWINLAQNKDK